MSILKELVYNGITYTEITISEVPESLRSKVAQVNRERKACIRNSYWVAKKSDCEIVEGFLVTQFPEKDELDVVGHAWNKYQDVHFDITLGVIGDAQGVQHQYFAREVYNVSQANITMEFFPVLGEKLSFKTEVVDVEQDVRKYVNQDRPLS